MKSPALSLLPKILIAITLGLVCSLFFPSWAIRIFATFNSLFGNFLGMFVPVLIIGLISSGIADLGKGAGRMLLLTAVLAYVSTVLAGMFSFDVCRTSLPHILGKDTQIFGSGAEEISFTPFFVIEIPKFIDVTSALVLSFLLGLSMTFIKGTSMKGLADDLKDIVTLVINKVLIPTLPIYIFGIFLIMGAQGSMAAQISLFLKIIVLIFAMHITVLILQFCIAGIVAKKNPFKALIKMLPAYATALGTSSSAATIPVTLEQTKKNGVREEIANFTVPLCATIHMPCSLLKITACAYVLMYSMHIPIDTGTFIQFIFIGAITMVAAPGVPGGSIMAALGPLASILGFTAEMQATMIALYIVMDSFGTAGNVTGDGAIAMIIDRVYKKNNSEN